MTAYPPEWYTEADAARARAEATADGPDPELTVDGAGCAQRDLDAYLDWAGNQPTMTQSEFESRQAAAAARGEAVEIDARIIPNPEPEAGQ